MKTVRRLLYTSILTAVLFVASAFLSLFFFIDFVEELSDVGKGGYTLANAVWYCVLLLPRHCYDLMPIAVLIGAIYALARLAQSSEFTILRTSGLGPGQALSLLGTLGVLFSGVTWALGDIAAPAAQRAATLFKVQFDGPIGLGRTGAWIKDVQSRAGQEYRIAVNVGKVLGEGHLQHIRILEMDGNGRIVTHVKAQEARVSSDAWVLQGVHLVQWQQDSSPSSTSSQTNAEGHWISEYLDTWRWSTTLNTKVVTASTLPLNTMTTSALFHYLRHLQANEQETDRYAIAFWQRALYPPANLVMLGLALPFAYLHARRGSISIKVFGGIMLGISFVLLNHVSSHLGQLRHWVPWLAASAPSMIYLVLSLFAFAWLVRFR